MDWLTQLPAIVLVAAWLAITVSIVFTARVGVRALVPGAEHDQIPQIAGPLMPALGAAFGILMALTVASEAGYLKSAQEVVAAEAAAASRLAWAATAPGVDSAPIHDALLGYLEATRDAEWRGDAAAEGRTDVVDELAILERVVRTEASSTELSTAESAELLTSLDSLTSGRRSRIAAASRHIPVLYAITLIASGVALIVNAGALGAGSSVRTSLLTLGLAIVVGLSLALMFALTAPWRGGMIVGTQPISSMIADLRAGLFR